MTQNNQTMKEVIINKIQSIKAIEYGKLLILFGDSNKQPEKKDDDDKQKPEKDKNSNVKSTTNHSKDGIPDDISSINKPTKENTSNDGQSTENMFSSFLYYLKKKK